MATVVVVGASLAGITAARALRSQGFEGRVVIVGAERHQPYDRPPLSKEFLAGKLGVADLSLAAPGDEALGWEWRMGTAAAALAAGPAPAANGLATNGGCVVELTSGESLACDGVVVATGARARTLPLVGSAGRPPSEATVSAEPPVGVHTLRTLDDAVALREVLVTGARLVVVGAGFIGAEVASTARDLGVEVTVVEAMETPLAGPLGRQMGEVCAHLHEEHGVRLITGVGVAELLAEPAADGRSHHRRLSGVRLADGREIPADVVLVGVGSVPNTEWLEGSGLHGAEVTGLAGGVRTDAAGATNLAGVVATGDCAAADSPFAGRVLRAEHWTHAMQHPPLAVATLLGQPPPNRPKTAGVPYFWSDQYGLRLQFAGHRVDGDVVEVVDGDITARSFVAVYHRNGRPVAALGLDRPKAFGAWRRTLATS